MIDSPGATGRVLPRRRAPGPFGRVAVATGVLLFTACGGQKTITVPLSGDGVSVEPVAQVDVPPLYGVHDTYVRDGIAFVCVWNAGLLIYDVGKGLAGGRPEAPMLLSSLVTAANGLPGPQVHNAWWFHNPNTGERRYAFIGQEGPGSVGVSAAGDIHVVDVSDLRAPVEVAFFHLTGAGTHNFWMDEGAAILYAGYYNAGVVALDVSGELSGDLASRLVLQTTPGGDGSSYVWGVMLHRGGLYASDMLDGLYRLPPHGATSPGIALGAVGERYSSDLWLHGDWAFTGTWGYRLERGDAVNIWRLGDDDPRLRSTLVIPAISTVGDVEVSRDGRLLLVATEGGPNAGMHLFDVQTPDEPVHLARHVMVEGVHTATFGYVDGKTYVFAARNPPAPAMLIYDVSRF